MPEVARRSRRALLLIPLLLLFFAGQGAYRWVVDRLAPVEPGAVATVITVDIPAGAGAKQTADLLQQKNLIRDALVFRYYARYRKLDSQIHSGEYELSPKMTPDQILAKLTRGDVVVHRFTVPEGLTLVDIAERLAQQGVVDKQKFLDAAARSTLADRYLPAGEKPAQPLEGYLFPSTYEFRPGMTADEVISMMFTAFENVWTPEFKQRAAERKLTVHEAMTLASIVEAEAQVAKERPIISGVYTNRMDIGMKLDADPTIRYFLQKPPQQELLYTDLDVDSPYNTYKNSGLPPGPIAAAGKASIQAALWPAKHDFWYFVARADGSGEHYFAKTLGEQETNTDKARESAKK